jgi:hypothetical protein
MSRNKLLIFGAVALVAAVVIVVLLTGGGPDRFIYGVKPVGPDEAILLTRHNDETSRYFVELVRVDGTLVWSAETTPFETAEALGHSGVAADAGHVFLVGDRHREGGSDVVVRALDRVSGELRWETTLAQGVEMRRIGPSLLTDAGRVIAVHTVPEKGAAETEGGPKSHETITALAADTGARVWPADGADAPRDPRTVVVTGPGRLVWASLEGRSGADGNLVDNGVELDTATGERRQQVPVFWDACMTPAGLIAFGLDETSFLPSGEGGLGQPRTLTRAAAWRVGGVGAPCGVHDGLAILGMAPGLPPEGSPDSRVLVAVDLATSEVRWTRTFDGRHAFGDFHAAPGGLPRMLPVVTIGQGAETWRVTWFTAIVDLTNGELLAESASDGHPAILSTPTRAVIHDTRHMTLVSVDGATGETSQPVHVVGGGWRELQAEDFHFGRLWLTADTWAGPDDLPWGVMDLDAWKIVHTHGEIKLPGFEAAPR